MPYFNDKVVWITGASSGIGKAVAEQLLREGVTCILSARNESALQEVARNAIDPEKVYVLPMDLNEVDKIPIHAQEAMAKYQSVDVLILSGGISQRSFALDTEMSVNRKLMEINYFSSIALTRALLPSMIENGYGHIVPVSSLVGKFGTPYRSAYSGSKHALHGFFDSLRAELHDKGIVVSIVTPGFVKTALSFNALVADGSTNDKMDDAQDKAMSAELFAKKMIKAIEAQKEEVYIGGKEVFGVYLKRFLPGVFSKMIRKVKVR